MPALHKIKCELQTIRRGYKLLYSIDRDVILYKALRALIAVISPYTALYFTSQLINGIAAKKAFGQLMGYAVFIVGINLILSVLNRIVSRKVNIADQNIWYSISLYFNSVNMKMQYEHLENPETHLKRDRIFQAQNANGFGVMLLSWKVEAFVNAAASIILSAALTVSLFTLKAPGEYAGLWALFNSPFSVLIILALLCLNLITSIRITGKSSAVFHKEIKNLAEDNRVAFFYREHIDNYESAAEIRIFNEAPLIQKSWLNYMLHPAYLTNIVRANARFARIQTVVRFIMNLVLYIFIGAKAYMGAFGIGNFVLYTGTVAKFVSAVTDLFDLFAQLKNNNVYLREIFEYIDMPNTMYQGTLPVEKRAFCESGDNDYEIEFRNVSFKYPASEVYALRHVSIRFRVGTRLAVVGMNGSGKTTFIKLLCRLYDPTEGEILLNGIDIKKYNYDEYISIFSVVFQDFKLFSFSLGQNVAAGIAYDRARAKACLEKAGFGARLQELPDGLDTCLYKDFEETGVEISGGEAQKIALARALYKDAPFIVLDEPTASLDPVAEYEVYSKFNDIVDNKTAIYISHRLSSCRFCDEIAVFDHGRIVQQGSHEELAADGNGKYYELWCAQSQYYNPSEP